MQFWDQAHGVQQLFLYKDSVILISPGAQHQSHVQLPASCTALCMHYTGISDHFSVL